MPRFRRLLALVSVRSDRSTAERLTRSATALLAPVAFVGLVASPAGAQAGSASDTPLHLADSHFEFVASGEAKPPTKPLAVHNGGSAPLTDVRLTRLAYADSARGAAWLVALPRQSLVAPDELATVGTLCVDAAGLLAGTYRATAAVGAREVREPVALTVTLVVTDAGARTSQPTARCGTSSTK